MSRSQRYRDLVERLCELRHCFLPKKFDPYGNYDNGELLKASAYVVLVHAELESFIEDRARQTASASIKSWKDHKRANCVLVGLVAKYSKIYNVNEGGNNEKINITDQIDKSMEAFSKDIEGNHGIREYNISKLLTSIGIEMESFDATWILNMNNYSKKRGEIAHQSRKKYSTTKQINPEEEFKTVNSLVHDGLKKLDLITEGLIKGSHVINVDLILDDFQVKDPESEISEGIEGLFLS